MSTSKMASPSLPLREPTDPGFLSELHAPARAQFQVHTRSGGRISLISFSVRPGDTPRTAGLGARGKGPRELEAVALERQGLAQ